VVGETSDNGTGPVAVDPQLPVGCFVGLIHSALSSLNTGVDYLCTVQVINLLIYHM
jgi:hypothetical protein